jgi:hypothetical protein
MISVPIWLFVLLCLPLGISTLAAIVLAVAAVVNKIVYKDELDND